jgi:hypothetical protein
MTLMASFIVQDKFDRRRLKNQGRVQPPDSALKKVGPKEEFNLDDEVKRLEATVDLDNWKQVRVPRPDEKA